MHARKKVAIRRGVIMGWLSRSSAGRGGRFRNPFLFEAAKGAAFGLDSRLGTTRGLSVAAAACSIRPLQGRGFNSLHGDIKTDRVVFCKAVEMGDASQRLASSRASPRLPPGRGNPALPSGLVKNLGLRLNNSGL